MNILIIKPSSLGDVIHALPFLGAVKDTFPDASIDWVISKNLQGLLEGHPMINELIPFNKDAWKNLRHLSDTLSEAKALRKKLQSRHYDWVVDLQGLLRSGILSYFAPGARKIGFDDAREGYLPGFFVAPMRQLSIQGQKVSFQIDQIHLAECYHLKVQGQAPVDP